MHPILKIKQCRKHNVILRLQFFFSANQSLALFASIIITIILETLLGTKEMISSNTTAPTACDCSCSSQIVGMASIWIVMTTKATWHIQV